MKRPGVCAICGGQTSDPTVHRCQRCWFASDDFRRAICASLPAARLSRNAREAAVDPVAVARLVAGDPPGRVTRAERQQAVRVLSRRGMSAAQIAETIGATSRTVVRMRARIRAAA